MLLSEPLRTPFTRSSGPPTWVPLGRCSQDPLQPIRPLVGETVAQGRVTGQLAHEEFVVLVDVRLEVVVGLRSRLGGVDYPGELQYAPVVVLFLYRFGQARVVPLGVFQAVFDDVCRHALTSSVPSAHSSAPVGTRHRGVIGSRRLPAGSG